MDSVWLAGTIVSAYVTTVGAVVAALILRSNGRKSKKNPESWNGKERRKDPWHSAPCPYLENVTNGLAGIEARLAAIEGILMGKK